MLSLKAQKGTLLAARRFARAAINAIETTRDGAEFDLAIAEALSSAHRTVDFLDEAIANIEIEVENNNV